jgi:hypothetical protein
MAESSERALTPDEASCVAAARDEALGRLPSSRPAIIPFEDT